MGIDLAGRRAYVCEVATHTRGLQYNRRDPDGVRRVDNYERLYKKFKKDIKYCRKYLPELSHAFEFWSPVVRAAREGASSNPAGDMQRLAETLRLEEGIDLTLVTNREYAARIDELRDKACRITRDVPIGVFRFLQIEAACRRYA